MFWKFDQQLGMEEPTGLRGGSNNFTSSNAAAYGKRTLCLSSLSSRRCECWYVLLILFVIFTAAGDHWATDAVKLVASSAVKGDGTGTTVVEVVDYDGFMPTINVTLQDFYGQGIVTEHDLFTQLTVPSKSSSQDCGSGPSGNIGGGIIARFEGGVATFADVDAFCAPGGMMFINATTSMGVQPAEFQVLFRRCVIGGECSTLKWW